MSNRWLVPTAALGFLLVLTAARPASMQTDMLTDDQLCELWIAHQLAELTDVWERRYGVTVWCHSPEEYSDPGIFVTAATANGQGFSGPSAEGDRLDAEERIRGWIENVVEAQGWHERYSNTVTVQVPF